MKEAPPLNIILLGAPAAGKGTQASRLARTYGMYNLDMGQEIRKPAMRKLFDYEHTTAMGKLTPTKIVRQIFADVIASIPARQGILFNGTPKMINEAKLVKRLLRENGRTAPLVIYLTLPERETIRRMEKRTEYVNGRLVRRDDDTVRALVNRRKYYKAQVSRVVTFFRKNYNVKDISGTGTESAVATRVARAVKEHIKKYGA